MRFFMFSVLGVSGGIYRTIFLLGPQFMYNLIAGKRKACSKNTRPSSGNIARGSRKERRSICWYTDSQSVKTVEKKGSVDLTRIKELRDGNDTYWLITLD